ncbi:MAG: hypothetical protein KY432_10690 [Acidobacteria bacterium]|nr:hypothetical protein [Acidobacteriota bacterium]
MGDLRFSFLNPRDQSAVVMLEQMFFIDNSDAKLNGKDLGQPVRLEQNPTIGDVALPTRPSIA